MQVKGLTGPLQSVTSGSSHVCALVHNSGAWCWGFNDDGQLGDGTTTNRSTPVAVSGLPLNLAQIAAADDHTCALLLNQTVKCWGLNSKGQLGDGTTSNSSTPVKVAGLTGAVQIALGDGYTCALLASGDVQCWGLNAFGELGDGGTTDSKSPVQVSGLTSGVQAISGADASVCAVLQSAQVDCWGDNTSGELGNGSTGGQSDTPGWCWAAPSPPTVPRSASAASGHESVPSTPVRWPSAGASTTTARPVTGLTTSTGSPWSGAGAVNPRACRDVRWSRQARPVACSGKAPVGRLRARPVRPHPAGM